MAADVALVGIAAFGCGVVNSLAGGGSLLLFPALLSTGMGSLAANVTNSVATLPGYVGGAIGFREELRIHRHRLAALGVAAAVGATAGSALLLVTPEATFDAVVPILVAAAALLIGVQPSVQRRIVAGSRPTTTGGVVGTAVATVYGGYFGAGLGVILLAILGLAVPAPLRELNGLKTALSVVSAAVTVVVFSIFGPVRWEWVLLSAPLTMAGGYAGSHLARRVAEPVLRRSIVVFGLLLAVALAAT